MVANGADFQLLVDIGGGTFVLVSAIDKYGEKQDTTEQEHATFGGTRLIAPDVRKIQFTCSGYRDVTDPGQIALRAAQRGRAAVAVKVLHDGVNGFQCNVRVRSFSADASGDGGPQPIAYEFTADPTGAIVIGAGPAL